MEAIILSISNTIILVGTLGYLYISERKREMAEKERFREFVIANKSKDINEYIEAIPDDKPFEVKQEDELVDLDQLSPEELLEIKIKENANN